MNYVVTLEITIEANNRKDALNKVDNLLKDIPYVELYDAQLVPDDWLDTKKCLNPQCHRTTPSNVDYCCRPCKLAHEGKYSVTGLHSARCEKAKNEHFPNN